MRRKRVKEGEGAKTYSPLDVDDRKEGGRERGGERRDISVCHRGRSGAEFVVLRELSRE